MFSCYIILRLLLKEIETIINKKFNNITECKEELKIIGEYSINNSIEKIKNEAGVRAMLDERDKYIHFIGNISMNDLTNVIPLPYNRILTKNEIDYIYEKLNNIWNYDGGYWNPLKEKSPLEVVYIMENNIFENDKNSIIEYLANESKMFYTVDEFGYNYETEIMYLTGSETVYTSKEFNWIIYISHEGTVAFGGQQLINFIKKIFSNRMDKINNWE
jgi:hypothetical protein